jgi:ribosomal protein S18 acetylase RimI-like enzyme
MVQAPDIAIVRLENEQQVRQCARLMVGSEPWITLRRTYRDCLRLLHDPSREIYLALIEDQMVGFIILAMQGVFRGYIQTVGVKPEWRNRGIGTRLVRFAEERIFRESPNVFICASSFNKRAQALYRRLGYRRVGELKDFVVAGQSEILMRKTIAPLAEFKPSPRRQRTTAKRG